ncbi:MULTISPECIES: hypothetical protein [unclassified Mycolicibacterium]|uniref:hypothetical protein n=1 Tax=unclassified Mycolicibacterium TaxID=2636767 RepID=UPI0012DF43AF|nr:MULTISPECIES: hypothetical protein [unclassified Mycolicibacterium]MUL61123.1 hypothetical protein [Mycolicibacterium sp. CBMA 335]
MENPADNAAAAAEAMVSAGLTAARICAAEQMLAIFQSAGLMLDGKVTSAAIAAALSERNPDDPLYVVLKPWEEQWALLVVRFAESANRVPKSVDVLAVEAARERGARWSEIGEALGITPQSAHSRYGPRRSGGRTEIRRRIGGRGGV